MPLIPDAETANPSYVWSQAEPAGVRGVLAISGLEPPTANGNLVHAGTYNGKPQWTSWGSGEEPLTTTRLKLRWENGTWKLTYERYPEAGPPSFGTWEDALIRQWPWQQTMWMVSSSPSIGGTPVIRRTGIMPAPRGTAPEADAAVPGDPAGLVPPADAATPQNPGGLVPAP
jgi:hypothetical protein